MSNAKDKTKPIENREVLNVQKFINSTGAEYNPMLFNKYIDRFDKFADSELANIKTAIYDKDTRQIYRSCMKLISSAGQLHAERLMDVLVKMNAISKLNIEDPGSAVDFERLEEFYGEMIAEMKTVKIRIGECLNRQPYIKVIDQHIAEYESKLINKKSQYMTDQHDQAGERDIEVKLDKSSNQALEIENQYGGQRECSKDKRSCCRLI